MLVPTRKQIKEWRDRWGNPEDINTRKKISGIYEFLDETRTDVKSAMAGIVSYIKKTFNIDPIVGSLFDRPEDPDIGLGLEKIPDLRGFPFYRMDFDYSPILRNIKCDGWYMEGSLWESLDLDNSRFAYSKLDYADMRGCKLNHANFYKAKLRSCNMTTAELRHANFLYTDLSGSDLEASNVAGALFYQSNVISTNFKNVDFLENIYKKANEIGEILSDSEQLLKVCLKSKFISTSFAPRLRYKFYRFFGEKYDFIFYVQRKLPIFNPNFPFSEKNLFHQKKIKVHPIFRKMKITNFEGVSTDHIDWTKNRSLERFIKDQQFLIEFKANHPRLYFWWNLFSKCGQSILRLTFWILFVIFGFAFIYHELDVVNLLQEDKLSGFWAPLYTSVNIFSNLGMGYKEPITKFGSVLIMIETMLGFVALGLLLTVAGSRFARRS